MKHIVIVGGGFAGVGTSHRLLKSLEKSTTAPYKVTLVSRDSHFYWNIAATRGILPDEIPDEKLFQPIAAGVHRYGPGKSEFVLGTVTSIDVDGKQLTVSDPDGGQTNISYDYLVLGTGSRTKVDGPFKSSGSTEATKEVVHEYQKRVKKAKSVVVVGAGPTGVEVAGDLGFKYGTSKEITLIAAGPTVLEGAPASVTAIALKALRDLKVNVVLSTKVKEAVELPNGGHKLILFDGKELLVDLYIPTFGVVPNSSFVPPQFLDSNGFIKVDEYLHVKSADGVFAIGDINDCEPPQFWSVEKQSVYLAKQLVRKITGKPVVPYQSSTKAQMGIQIGKKAGTGHMGNFKLPGFLVVKIRSTLFVERLPKSVDGSMY